MTEELVRNIVIGLAIVIPVIGVIMALKWKSRNFKGSPSKGGYFQKKKSDRKLD